MRLFLVLPLCFSVGCVATAPVHRYKHVVFPQEPVYQPLLSGPPETGGMHSGYVVLKAGEDMHLHSTEGNEEMLVFLRGAGTVVLAGEKVAVAAGEGLYIPPHTEHEVHNAGPDELRYVYTVAPASK
jgi:mannose-6-phosphate isomerase-like protein (cupin superfamily)